jgi:hypothetical protein
MAIMSFLFRPRRKFRRVVAPKTELQLQAADLFQAGYLIGAAATARHDLEHTLREICEGVALWDGHCFKTGPTHTLATYLWKHNIIDVGWQKRIGKFTKRAGAVIHNRNVHSIRVAWLLYECGHIVAYLRGRKPLVPQIVSGGRYE